MPNQTEAIERALPPIPVSINHLSVLEEPVKPGPQSSTEQLDLYSIEFDPDQTSLGDIQLRDHPTDNIGIVTPNMKPDQVRAAIEKSKSNKFPHSPTNRIIIAPDEAAELIRQGIPESPVISASEVGSILKEEEAYQRYGIRMPQTHTTGTLYLGALLVDRLVLNKTRGRKTESNLVYQITDKVHTSAIKPAILAHHHPDILYVQRQRDHRPGIDFSASSDIPIAKLLTGVQLSPSETYLIRRQLLDHMPISTSQYGQELVTLIAATEYANALQLPIGKVLDVMAEKIDIDSLVERKTKDYNQLLRILSEEVYQKGKRLIDADANDFKSINARLSQIEPLGQLLPSAHQLIRDQVVNLDSVRMIEKRLHARKFSGIPSIVHRFMPAHMADPNAEDTPAKVVKELDAAIQDGKTSPPTATIQVDTTHVVVRNRATGARKREAQHGAGKDDRTKWDEINQGLFLFNPGERTIDTDDDITSYPKKIYLEDSEELAYAAEEFFHDHQIPIILPAFKEDTGWDVARAASEISPGRVIMASPDKRTLADASRFCIAIDQNKVLTFINIDKLKKMGIIPSNREVPLRGKGFSILAAWLWGMANGYIRPGEYVAHVDTDITNMDKDGVAYNRDRIDRKLRKPYRPLEYMAAALAQMPPSHRAIAIQPAKVGPPRKGEVKHPTFQMFMNSEDPFLRAVGYGLSRVVWPSPGESMVISDLYNEGPWQVTTGFDLDRYFKAILRELVKDGKFGEEDIRDVFAQVVIPADKIENGSVAEVNDYTEVGWATSVYYHALEFYWKLYDAFRAKQNLQPLLETLSEQQQQLLPPELIERLKYPDPTLPPLYGVDHISLFNEIYAGTQERIIAPTPPDSTREIDGTIVYSADELYDKAAGPNQIQYRFHPWYLPSVNWMIENGIIDMDGIKDIKPIKQGERRKSGAHFGDDK